MTELLRGELALDEPHPSAFMALRWLRSLPPQDLIIWQETFASCSLSGIRLAEICSETLNRLLTGKPVSDRYILGLAWSMRHAGEEFKIDTKKAGAKSEEGSSSKRKAKRATSKGSRSKNDR